MLSQHKKCLFIIIFCSKRKQMLTKRHYSLIPVNLY